MKTIDKTKAYNAKQQLLQLKTNIEPLIQDFFDKKHADTKKVFDEENIKAVEFAGELTSRHAKRLRASFAFYTYKMVGGKKDDVALQLGMAIELMHVYLLIVDDYMDMSEYRRGKKTMHEIFKDLVSSPKYDTQNTNKTHLANSLAVTTGLSISHIANTLITNLHTTCEIKLKLLEQMNIAIEQTSYGQIKDVINPVRKQVSQEEVLEMLKYKTGIYTYQNPITLGYILGGKSNESELKALNDYAIPGGIAFQIIDDILGMFGKQEETGKSNMDDLKEGKYTLLIQHAMQKASNTQKKELKRCLGNRNITKTNHQNVQQIIIDTGALESNKNLAEQLTQQALNSLENPILNKYKNEFMDYLIGISEYVLIRTE